MGTNKSGKRRPEQAWGDGVAPPVDAGNADPAGQKASEFKAGKGKVVRDSFTMPAVEYARIDDLKRRCLSAGLHVRKTDILRAAIALLAGMETKGAVDQILALPPIKTGRPSKR